MHKEILEEIERISQMDISSEDKIGLLLVAKDYFLGKVKNKNAIRLFVHSMAFVLISISLVFFFLELSFLPAETPLITFLPGICFLIASLFLKSTEKEKIILGKTRTYGALKEAILTQVSLSGERLDSISRSLNKSEAALRAKLVSMDLYDIYQENFYEKHIKDIKKIGKKLSKEDIKPIIDEEERRKNRINNFKALIKLGESKNVEFKESFETDIKTAEHRVVLRNSIWIAIDSFLNTRGGHVFVGVSDLLKIVGLVHDKHRSDDAWFLYINGLLNKVFKLSVLNYIETYIEIIDDKRLLIFKVSKANEITPVTLEKEDKELDQKFKNKELYYARLRNQTKLLEGTDLLEHKKEFFD